MKRTDRRIVPETHPRSGIVSVKAGCDRSELVITEGALTDAAVRGLMDDRLLLTIVERLIQYAVTATSRRVSVWNDVVAFTRGTARTFSASPPSRTRSGSVESARPWRVGALWRSTFASMRPCPGKHSRGERRCKPCSRQPNVFPSHSIAC